MSLDFERKIKERCKKEHKLFFYEEADSTNRIALDYMSSGKAEGGEVFIARKQTAGKGTRGRSFFSEGGLYMSVILKNNRKIKNYTLFAAVCVCKTLEALYEVNCGIKWVNDILIDGKKVCGILCASRIESGKSEPDFIIVGVGINTNTSDFPQELKHIANSLSLYKGEKIDDSLLASELLFLLDCENFSLEDYTDRMLICGKEICVTLSNKSSVFGKALRIDEDGALILKDNEANEIRIISGDVSILNCEENQ